MVECLLFSDHVVALAVLWILGWLMTIGLMIDNQPDASIGVVIVAWIVILIASFFAWPILFGRWLAQTH